VDNEVRSQKREKKKGEKKQTQIKEAGKGRSPRNSGPTPVARGSSGAKDLRLPRAQLTMHLATVEAIQRASQGQALALAVSYSLHYDKNYSQLTQFCPRPPANTASQTRPDASMLSAMGC